MEDGGNGRLLLMGSHARQPVMMGETEASLAATGRELTARDPIIRPPRCHR